MRALFRRGAEPPGSEASPGARWRHLRALLIPGLVLGALILFAWPESSRHLPFPDSMAYVNWPSYTAFSGVEYPSRRPPSYPMLLKLVRPGPVLVHLQIWFSLGSWCLLGWVLARTPGLFLGGLLALAAPVRLWNAAVLTESMSLSFLVLTFALSLMLYRRWRVWLFGAWLLCALYFGFLRDSNLLLLPFFAVPLLRHGWRRFGLAAALLVVAMLVGVISAQLEQRWKVPYYTVFTNRIARNPEAREYFEARGMPGSLARLRMTPEMNTWMMERGRGLYQAWVVSRPESYRVVWKQLRKEGEGEFLRRRYFEKRLKNVPEPRVAPASEWLYRLSNPPRWVWLGFLCLPLLDWLRNRQVGALSIWVAVLVPGAYGLAFATYHGAGTEVVRHMLMVSMVYRLTFFLAAFVVIERLVLSGGRGGPGAPRGAHGTEPPPAA